MNVLVNSYYFTPNYKLYICICLHFYKLYVCIFFILVLLKLCLFQWLCLGKDRKLSCCNYYHWNDRHSSEPWIPAGTNIIWVLEPWPVVWRSCKGERNMRYLTPVPFGTLRRLQMNTVERCRQGTANLTTKISSQKTQKIHSWLMVTAGDRVGHWGMEALFYQCRGNKWRHSAER